jgi:hypothetical protein
MKDERLKSDIINKKSNYYLRHIDNISNVTPIKSVFKPFLSEENIEENLKKKTIEHKKFDNSIIYKFKNKTRRIKDI